MARVLALVGATAGLAAAGHAVATLSVAPVKPAVGLSATAGAVALLAAAYRSRTFLSPPTIMGVPLLLGLATSMLESTRIFTDWTVPDVALAALVVIAPLAGGALAVALTGPVPALVTSPRHRPARPKATMRFAVGLFLFGALMLATIYSAAGQVPLFTSNVDVARFRLRADGLLFILAEGIALSALIAAWALFGHRSSFSGRQRAVLASLLCLAPLLAATQGGRSVVIGTAVGPALIALRYQPWHRARRAVVVTAAALLVALSVLFVARTYDNPTSPLSEAVLYERTGDERSAFGVALTGLSFSLGENQRTLLELRKARRSYPAPSTSIWFAHRFLPQAQDPAKIADDITKRWITSTYAGALVIDLGLEAALLFGVGIGFLGLLAYRRFAVGRTARAVLVYAYLAVPLLMLFYVNLPLEYPHILTNLVAIAILAPLLERPGGET